MSLSICLDLVTLGRKSDPAHDGPGSKKGQAPGFDEGRGVILVPVRSDADVPFVRLQDSVQAWHEQLQLHAIRRGTEMVVLQLNRLLRRGPFASKDTSPVDMVNGLVMLPVGMPDSVVQWQPYNVVSLITHVGQAPTSLPRHVLQCRGYVHY